MNGATDMKMIEDQYKMRSAAASHQCRGMWPKFPRLWHQISV